MGIERCWNLESLNQNQALEYIMSKDNKDAKKYVEGTKVENLFYFIFFKPQSACIVEMIFIHF
jgi:hypothetical protein